MYRNEYGKHPFLTIAQTTEITPEEAKKIAADDVSMQIREWLDGETADD